MHYQQIQDARAFICSLTTLRPRTGIVLGTGLSGLADAIEADTLIDYKDIPHFPVSTVEGHAGRLILGTLDGVPVVAMAGRFHYYEGYSMQQVTFPVRVLKALGINCLILSNAAGSINAEMEAGDIVFIKDHINLLPDNPLRGPNDERLGLRFPDMLHTYDRDLLNRAMALARTNGLRAHTGVYASLPGPNLETPAEYRFLHRIGADVVGMSTVPEVLTARHAGLKVLAVSVVSNKCFPIEQLTETTLEEVIAVMDKASQGVIQVVRGVIRN
ncbi:MAG TPA: purine-nucleoside phosphorylase [Bacteroidetes bacterium]|nr:purine-nucleoside phosphorylase [Bacteroidota bacterium]